MAVYTLAVLLLIVGLLSGFSILAGRVEAAMWQKSHHSEERLRLQQQITMGKSHCR